MSYHTLKVMFDSRGVLFVALNRPEVRNAFDSQVMDDLTQVFSVGALQKEVRVRCPAKAKGLPFVQAAI